MVDKPLVYSAMNIVFELERLMHTALPLSQGAKHLLVTVLSVHSKTGSSTYCGRCEYHHWQWDWIEGIVIIEI